MKISNDLEQELWDVANTLADIARPIALSYFRQSGQAVENKYTDGFDPVTKADKEIEAAMREHLAKHRPDDGILGEEYSSVAGKSGLTWVLDPIDGTRGFMSGTPTWGVLIAVDSGQGPILGVIDQPFTKERFSGGLGVSHWRRGSDHTPLQTSNKTALSDAVIFSTYPEVGSSAERLAFESVADKCLLTRFGTDCYAYGLLAAGHVDLVIEAGLQAFDIQAPMAVVEAAGGVVTDWNGHSPHQGGQVVAAATPELHAAVLEILAISQETL